MTTRLKVGVFGTGALGRHHTRILAGRPDVEVVGIHDANPETAGKVAAEFGVPVVPSFLILADAVDAAVLAVPTVLHCELGASLLERGVHLLVEKPIASTLEEADRLIDSAKRAGRTLAVGHVEFHNPAVEALLDLGLEPRFVEFDRLGVFSPRSLDVDVILDLMIHDLQILHALDASPVAEVRAIGIPVLSAKIDIVSARVQLESGLVANLTASRVSAEKSRKLRAFFPNRYHSLDYTAQEVKGYRLEMKHGAREIAPAPLAVEKAEPLAREMDAFLAACRGTRARIVTGDEGRRALATALAVADAAARVG